MGLLCTYCCICLLALKPHHSPYLHHPPHHSHLTAHKTTEKHHPYLSHGKQKPTPSHTSPYSNHPTLDRKLCHCTHPPPRLHKIAFPPSGRLRCGGPRAMVPSDPVPSNRSPPRPQAPQMSTWLRYTPAPSVSLSSS